MKIFILILTFVITLPVYAYNYNTSLSQKIEDISVQLEKNPSIGLYIKRAKLYIEDKNYSYAVYDLNDAIKNDEYNLEAYILKAKAQFLNNKFDEAKHSLNSVFSGIIYDLYKGTNNKLYAEAYYIRSQISKNEGNDWQADYDKAISMGYKEKLPDENKSKKSNTNKFNTGINFGNTFKYPNQW